jgi:hypothetical protein
MEDAGPACEPRLGDPLNVSLPDEGVQFLDFSPKLGSLGRLRELKRATPYLHASNPDRARSQLQGDRQPELWEVRSGEVIFSDQAAVVTTLRPSDRLLQCHHGTARDGDGPA